METKTIGGRHTYRSDIGWLPTKLTGFPKLVVIVAPPRLLHSDVYPLKRPGYVMPHQRAVCKAISIARETLDIKATLWDLHDWALSGFLAQGYRSIEGSEETVIAGLEKTG